MNGFCVMGPVATQDDYARLQAEVVRLLGEPRLGHVIADVWVEEGLPEPKKRKAD